MASLQTHFSDCTEGQVNLNLRLVHMQSYRTSEKSLSEYGMIEFYLDSLRHWEYAFMV